MLNKEGKELIVLDMKSHLIAVVRGRQHSFHWEVQCMIWSTEHYKISSGMEILLFSKLKSLHGLKRVY
jgi:hypothetical protein